MLENTNLNTPVEQLWVSTISAVPVTVTGWDLDDADDETWNYFEALTHDVDGVPTLLVTDAHSVLATKDANGALVFLANSVDDNRESYIEDNADENGDPTDGSLSEDTLERIGELDDVNESATGPAMNYWYPVESITDDSEAIAAAFTIAGLSLCVVQVDGAYGLALTGGGMDMSWDICAAYVMLGHLPPVHFSDLPDMAGNTVNPYILDAMMRALTVTAEQSTRQAERLREKFAPAVEVDPDLTVWAVTLAHTISIDLKVPAATAEAAHDIVNHRDYPAPPREVWTGHKDWSIRVFAPNGDEVISN